MSPVRPFRGGKWPRSAMGWPSVVVLSLAVAVASFASCAADNIATLVSINLRIGGTQAVRFFGAPAIYGPRLIPPGLSGQLVVVSPSNGCTPLYNVPATGPWIALIERGDCPFYQKTFNAYAAGARAAIIYDNNDSSSLVFMTSDTMPDDTIGMIPSFFVLRRDGVFMYTVEPQGVQATITPTLMVVNPDSAGSDTVAPWDPTAFYVIAGVLGAVTIAGGIVLYMMYRRPRPVAPATAPQALRKELVESLPTRVYHRRTSVSAPDGAGVAGDSDTSAEKERPVLEQPPMVPSVDSGTTDAAVAVAAAEARTPREKGRWRRLLRRRRLARRRTGARWCLCCRRRSSEDSQGQSDAAPLAETPAPAEAGPAVLEVGSEENRDTLDEADNAEECGDDVCPICLDDYAEGDILRTLPCNHEYHAACIDEWLLKRSGACPLCKRSVIDDVDLPQGGAATFDVEAHAEQANNSATDGNAEAPAYNPPAYDIPSEAPAYEREDSGFQMPHSLSMVDVELGTPRMAQSGAL